MINTRKFLINLMWVVFVILTFTYSEAIEDFMFRWGEDLCNELANTPYPGMLLSISAFLVSKYVAVLLVGWILLFMILSGLFQIWDSLITTRARRD